MFSILQATAMDIVTTPIPASPPQNFIPGVLSSLTIALICLLVMTVVSRNIKKQRLAQKAINHKLLDVSEYLSPVEFNILTRKRLALEDKETTLIDIKTWASFLLFMASISTIVCLALQSSASEPGNTSVSDALENIEKRFDVIVVKDDSSFIGENGNRKEYEIEVSVNSVGKVNCILAIVDQKRYSVFCESPKLKKAIPLSELALKRTNK